MAFAVACFIDRADPVYNYQLGRFSAATQLLLSLGFTPDSSGFVLAQQPDTTELDRVRESLLGAREAARDGGGLARNRSRNGISRMVPLMPLMAAAVEPDGAGVGLSRGGSMPAGGGRLLVSLARGRSVSSSILQPLTRGRSRVGSQGGATGDGDAAEGLLTAHPDDSGGQLEPTSSTLSRTPSRSGLVLSQTLSKLSRTVSAALGVKVRAFLALPLPFCQRLTPLLVLQEEFLCPICYCDELVERSYTLPCRHKFCRDCVAAFAENKIGDNLLTMTCPDLLTAPEQGGADVGCPQEIGLEIILELISPEARAKFDRFSAMRSDPNLRECPGPGNAEPAGGPCGTLVTPGRNSIRRIQPDMRCTVCELQFCFYHSNAHAGQSCREYELAQREAAQLNERAIAAATQKCPRCKTPTEKSSGWQKDPRSPMSPDYFVSVHFYRRITLNRGSFQQPHDVSISEWKWGRLQSGLVLDLRPLDTRWPNVPDALRMVECLRLPRHADD